jgi:hypothetical protein
MKIEKRDKARMIPIDTVSNVSAPNMIGVALAIAVQHSVAIIKKPNCFQGIIWPKLHPNSLQYFKSR